MASDSLADLAETVRTALAEDIGSGDITARLINASKQVTGRIISRAGGVLCGIPWVNEVYSQLDRGVALNWQLREGDSLKPDLVIARISGPARAVMTGERTALNFLQTLSGTATRTQYYVGLVAHTPVRILDTRKTLPGLRVAQKYAVRIGGGQNHRMGLFDAYLIKENHIIACGGIRRAVDRARHLMPDKPVEIEVRNPEQLDEALAACADVIMLDNFEVEDIRRAVAVNAGRSGLEVSGGIDEQSLVNIAETGVDYVSIGALTKHCRAADLSLLLD